MSIIERLKNVRNVNYRTTKKCRKCQLSNNLKMSEMSIIEQLKNVRNTNYRRNKKRQKCQSLNN